MTAQLKISVKELEQQTRDDADGFFDIGSDDSILLDGRFKPDEVRTILALHTLKHRKQERPTFLGKVIGGNIKGE